MKLREYYFGSNSVTCYFEFLTGLRKIQEDCFDMMVPCFLYSFHDFYGIFCQGLSLMLADLLVIHVGSLEMVHPCTVVRTNCFTKSTNLLLISSENFSSKTCLSVSHLPHKSVCLASCGELKPLTNLKQ